MADPTPPSPVRGYARERAHMRGDRIVPFLMSPNPAAGQGDSGTSSDPVAEGWAAPTGEGLVSRAGSAQQPDAEAQQRGAEVTQQPSGPVTQPARADVARQAGADEAQQPNDDVGEPQGRELGPEPGVEVADPAGPVESPLEPGPVAEVLVDVPLAHLDRPFDYLVPPELSAAAQPGVRVRVRFAGRDVEGFVVARKSAPDHEGRLAPLRTVVSPEPVLTPAILRLCRALAARYAGSVMDVVRLAIPARHATAERAADERRAKAEQERDADPGAGEELPRPELPELTEPGPWAQLPAGRALLRHLADGGRPWAAWSALPAGGDAQDDWPGAMASAAAATLAGGRGVVLVVPDHRDVDRLDAALSDRLGPGQHVRLTAAQGPQARYTAWLKVLRGEVRCVVGTRAAAYAPVRDVGLVAWWDDGDDLLEEPRAPYCATREVLVTRARQSGAALLAGGYAMSVEVAALVRSGATAPIEAPMSARHEAGPAITVAGDDWQQERDSAAAAARLPSIAWRSAKSALDQGRPVLVQVPRRGYVPALSCQECRQPARCAACHGPLAIPARGGEPACRWCGRVATAFECPQCGGRRVRAAVVGARRTAEELGRAFPGVPVRTSGAGEVIAQVPAAAALVISTPGAEPLAEGGYGAVLLLDAWALLDRGDLNAGVEALRRWMGAAALAAGRAPVVVVGAATDEPVPAVEALIRWDAGWLAQRELDERAELALPPAVTVVTIEGERRALEAALRSMDLGGGVDVLGPMPAPVRPGTPPQPGSMVGAEAGRRRPSKAEPARQALAQVRGTGAATASVSGADPAADRPRSPDPSPRYRAMLRAPLTEGPALVAAVRAERATRSARKDPEPLAIRVDPRDID